MNKIKYYIFTLLIISFNTHAADEDVISERMSAYWTAFTNSQFEEAATHVLPADLESIKEHVLPVFMKASEDDSAKVQRIVKPFFAEISDGPQADLTGEQAYMGLNNYFRNANKQAFDMLSESDIRVTNVTISEDDTALVEYTVRLEDLFQEDKEQFKKDGEDWFITLKENPEVTADRFRQAFGM